MKYVAKLLVLVTAGISLVACSELSQQDVGVLTGGAVGGLVGSRFGGGSGRVVAATAGTLIGAYIGGQIGNNMDETDRLKTSRALEDTPTGKTTSWRNPDNGNSYTVAPTRTYYEESSYGQTQPCREYTTTAIIGGKKEQVYGRACRMDDGSWKVIS